jgi:serine/threonine-protein kinase
MNSRRWDEIREVFDEIVELSEPERGSRLAAIGTTDPELREAVAVLLRADADADAWLAPVESPLGVALTPDGVSARTGSPDLEVRLQQALGKAYRIARELGGGGMSHVYLAEETAFRRKVVVKVLRPDLAEALSAKRFQREIQLVARLQHPHIVPLLSAGRGAPEAGVNELLYYTMPFVEGESLRDRLRREGELPIDDTVRIVRDVASALAYAHRHGVVHRDIKPENVLLSDGGALVADFGIAKALSASQAQGGDATSTTTITQASVALGTPLYMAPEQAAGDVAADHRVDIYALGALAYEMLAGRPPFEGRSAQQLMAAHATEEPDPVTKRRPNTPPGLAALVMRCLEKRPADRPRDAEQLLLALDHAASTASGSRVPSAGVHTAIAGSTRRATRVLTWALTAVLAGMVAGLVIQTWPRSQPQAQLSSPLRRLALLPCHDVSAERDQADIADRWSEELIQKLVRVAGLEPKSWISVGRYKDSRLPLRQIASELNADVLARCRVAEQPSAVRVDVELIRPGVDKVIWSHSYRQLPGHTGVNAAQAAAVRGIAQALGIEITPSAVAAVERPLTQDSLALRLYRLGRHFYMKLDVPSFRKSAEYYGRAIERDSGFAQAYVGLAQAIYFRSELEAVPSREWYPRCAWLIRKAISLDPTIAEAHSERAFHLMNYTYEWESADEEHRLAIAINPSSVDARLDYALYLITAERPKEAISQAERAMQLDPAYPLPRRYVLQALRYTRDDDRALRELREGLQITPDDPGLRHHLAHWFLRRGQRDSAAATVLAIDAPNVADVWILARSGRPDAARRMLDSLIVLDSSRAVDPVQIAMLHAALGRDNEALNWLERAYADRSAGLPNYLSVVIPFFDGLRHHPRFRALRRQVGFKDSAAVGR